MNRWLQFALVATLTFAITWSFTARPIATVETKPIAAMPSAPQPLVEEGPIATIEHRDIAASSHTINRNLFAYVSAPRPVPLERRALSPAPSAPVVVESVHRAESPVLQREPEKPRFDYRLIGRFGTDANPIAAFVREGEIVTARRGDRVGAFVVKEFGIESVEMESDAGSIRVALGR